MINSKIVIKFFIYIACTVTFFSCITEEPYPELDYNSHLNFIGTFGIINSEDPIGTVSLTISGGTFECNTNLPFGQGAGTILINKQTIDFLDTLYNPTPALYGPSCVLNGKYDYIFDGKKLSIWKENNIDDIEYELLLNN